MIILFAILMFAVFGKVLGFAFRAAWGFTKVFFTLFFLPAILIGLVFVGLIRLALPILVIAGIIMLARRFTGEVC
ncbi:MAG: hypothetical protein J5712_04440 [Lachnospiraceae bacterium]|nr:hypothetical protein [Lachnospiraceae bacterium]